MSNVPLAIADVQPSIIADSPRPGAQSHASPSPPAHNAWLGPQYHPGAPTVGRSAPSVAYGRVVQPDPTPPIAVPATTPPIAKPWECDWFNERKPTIDHWLHVLHDQFHCDDQCLVKLQRLSWDSVLGYQPANMLIGKLLKAVNDDTPIGNRSAFIETGVKHAWIIVVAARRTS